MKSARTFFIAALCGVALGALPLDLPGDGFGVDQAYAKGGNGGGNGGGGGNGNGGGGGGKGNSGGKSSGNSGAHGKSASAAGQTKSSISKADKKAAKTAAKEQQVASIAKQEKLTKEQNLNAKLGRLNSLKRNINAYINSKSPKFAAIQAFVTASAQSQIAQAAVAEALATRDEELAELDALNAELAALSAIATPTPEEQARRDALPGLITEQEDAVAAAEQDVTDAETAAAAAPAPTAGDLETALNEMANKPVDQDVIDWATEVLDGKVDEMRSVLEAAAAEEAAAAPETETPETETPETVEPVVPVEPAP